MHQDQRCSYTGELRTVFWHIMWAISSSDVGRSSLGKVILIVTGPATHTTPIPLQSLEVWESWQNLSLLLKA